MVILLYCRCCIMQKHKGWKALLPKLIERSNSGWSLHLSHFSSQISGYFIHAICILIIVTCIGWWRSALQGHHHTHSANQNHTDGSFMQFASLYCRVCGWQFEVKTEDFRFMVEGRDEWILLARTLCVITWLTKTFKHFEQKVNSSE